MITNLIIISNQEDAHAIFYIVTSSFLGPEFWQNDHQSHLIQ
jgi:hypothetical protein